MKYLRCDHDATTLYCRTHNVDSYALEGADRVRFGLEWQRDDVDIVAQEAAEAPEFWANHKHPRDESIAWDEDAEV